MRKQQGKVYDVTEQRPSKSINKKKQLHMHMVVDDAVPLSPPPRRAPKPVDEDLYKIPPELLRTTKRVCFFILFFVNCVLNKKISVILTLVYSIN